MKTTEEEEEFGNDPIVIYQGDMWLGKIPECYFPSEPASFDETSYQPCSESDGYD